MNGMNLLLFVVTAASLSLALVMAAVAWRARREQQLRAEARVAALADAIDGTLDPEAYAPYESPAGDVRLRTPAAAAAVPAESPATADVGAPGLFAATVAPAGHRRRAVPTIAILALIGVGLATTFLVLAGGDTKASGVAAEAVPARLELLSLRHEVQNGQLSVTGLVRNPGSSQALDRVAAVIFLFDGKGGFLASTRAPLDFPHLAPGEESPFSATIPSPPGLSRYRVSFRKETGGLVPHVDRRERN